ncbi:MAG: DUF6268 family outer membrane beta-barrel protein, partial [Planctomycetota bacterium]
EFEIDRFMAKISMINSIDQSNSYGFSFGYNYTDYSFSGSEGIAALKPWDDIHSIGFTVPIRMGLNDDWTMYAFPTIRSVTEDGADFGDGISGGALLGASRKINENLTMGPGLGVLSQIEDDPFVFPIFLIDWKISDTLSFGTGRGESATAGPGLFLYWRPDEQWLFNFGGRYEKLRFRLDDKGVAPDGVGEDRAFPLVAGATYYFNRQTSLTLTGGVLLGGQLKLEDDKGHKIIEEDYDPTPFIGINLRSKF